MDEAREAERAESFAISPSGPMFGSKMKLPEGEPLALEEGLLKAEGLPVPISIFPADCVWKESAARCGSRSVRRNCSRTMPVFCWNSHSPGVLTPRRFCGRS